MKGQLEFFCPKCIRFTKGKLRFDPALTRHVVECRKCALHVPVKIEILTERVAKDLRTERFIRLTKQYCRWDGFAYKLNEEGREVVRQFWNLVRLEHWLSGKGGWAVMRMDSPVVDEPEPPEPFWSMPFLILLPASPEGFKSIGTLKRFGEVYVAEDRREVEFIGRVLRMQRAGL